MDAPLYPPSRAYRQPAIAPTTDFGVDSVAVADLLRAPATLAILKEEVPGIEQRLQIPQLQPHLYNFTLRNIAQYGLVPRDKLPRIDERLRAVPVADRPSL
jgi:hypothetical protein